MIMDKPRRARPVVAILGGGLTGAATAFHLSRTIAPEEVEIIVVEPREALGRGLAYSSDEPAHRINVPASRMTLYGDDLNHFMNWLAAENIRMSPGTLTARGDFFPERGVFGSYVAAHLEPLLASGAVRHARAFAVSVTRSSERYLVDLSDGTALGADLMVLAMTHPAPSVPAPLRGLVASRRLVASPYDSARIAAIGQSERLLIVGAGLTSADVAASLARRGFRGRITALSRHGLRSRGHGVVSGKCAIDFAADAPPTAVGLLRRIRAAVAADEARGQSWHAVLDAIRDQGQEIWAVLPEGERRRLVRHLRTFWDVHRFRVAPQVEEALDLQVRLGRLETVAARLVSAREEEGGIVVEYRPRGCDEVASEVFDTVVVTTGPDHASALSSNPALRALAAEGLIAADPNGLGLHVAEHCRAVGGEGSVSDTLFVVGPLARGCVGELMGVPEVIRHAEHVAGVLAHKAGDIGKALPEAALAVG